MTWAPQFSDLAVTCTDGVQQLRALLALLGLAFRRRWGSRNLVCVWGALLAGSSLGVILKRKGCFSPGSP